MRAELHACGALLMGGVTAASGRVCLLDQTEPASAAGRPFLKCRGLALANFRKAAGTVTADGETFTYLVSFREHKGFTAG